MTHPVDPAVARAHADVLDLFRRNPAGLDEVCRAARDRLTAMPALDPLDPRTWNSYALITTDVQTLLGYLREAGVPSSEPERFRSLLIRVLYYLYESEKSKIGVLLAELVTSDWEARLGKSHADTLNATGRLAVCLYAQGEPKRARPLFAWVHQQRASQFGDDDPATLLAACNMGACLTELGHYRAAFLLNTDTVRRCERLFGKEHETTILATENLAGSLFGLERHRTALTLYRDAHRRRRRTSGEDSLLTLNAEASIAIALHKLEDYEAARAVNADLLPRFERVAGKDHSGTKHTHARLVKNLRALGRYEEAEEVHGGIPKYGSSTPEGGHRALAPRHRGV
ncbi:tetratricopeptide repeat protein [Streptomyces sp. NBC_01285]|uniref:tetratricopeptide repeat protein n=1 Tax=Streptomyces sp. NBC_01285 TaxID=2903813 RepID=UPI002259C66E|nr:tetratricopeptide repeat protein [Streptomyces sp. NBC_01285]MCX4773799.1 tetratricopeptide repeat protein [Streptomyces sp. NBC_01285]